MEGEASDIDPYFAQGKVSTIIPTLIAELASKDSGDSRLVGELLDLSQFVGSPAFQLIPSRLSGLVFGLGTGMR